MNLIFRTGQFLVLLFFSEKGNIIILNLHIITQEKKLKGDGKPVLILSNDNFSNTSQKDSSAY